jgi:hypothetical protein
MLLFRPNCVHTKRLKWSKTKEKTMDTLGISEKSIEIVGMAAQIAALESMTVGELQTRYQELFGEFTRSRNKIYLKKRLALRIQKLAEGVSSKNEDNQNGPTTESEKSETKSRSERKPKERDPRLPEPGSTITKEYKGTLHEVSVLETGFEYRGSHYKSLSRLAKEITGTTWNGFLFFNLAK